MPDEIIPNTEWGTGVHYWTRGIQYTTNYTPTYTTNATTMESTQKTPLRAKSNPKQLTIEDNNLSAPAKALRMFIPTVTFEDGYYCFYNNFNLRVEDGTIPIKGPLNLKIQISTFDGLFNKLPECNTFNKANFEGISDIILSCVCRRLLGTLTKDIVYFSSLGKRYLLNLIPKRKLIDTYLEHGGDFSIIEERIITAEETRLKSLVFKPERKKKETRDKPFGRPDNGGRFDVAQPRRNRRPQDTVGRFDGNMLDDAIQRAAHRIGLHTGNAGFIWGDPHVEDEGQTEEIRLDAPQRPDPNRMDGHPEFPTNAW